ncbi:MAG: hypothetical protein AAF438_13000 [Pseudomonadota bacterium]
MIRKIIGYLWLAFAVTGLAAAQSVPLKEPEVTSTMPDVDLKPPKAIEDQTADFVTLNDVAVDDPKRCITNLRWEQAEIINEQHILFRVSRKKYFVNYLDRRCSALKPGRKLLFQNRGSRTCRRDTVSVLETGSFGRTQVLSRGQFVTVPGNELGTCVLGYFNEVNEAGVAILRNQAEAERQLQKNRKLEKRRKKKEKKKKKDDAS